MGNIHGHSFRITTFGESHGPALGVIIDGCPPRVPFDAAFLRSELDRRRPGQSALTTQRKEADAPEVLSGVSHDGLTLGSPIAIVIRNGDQRPQAYAEMKAAYRPSHADFTYDAKYGIRAVEGGGRSSARETAARVAAGAVAKTVLKHACGARIIAWVESVGDVRMPTATVLKPQKTVRPDGRATELSAKGRHDPCVLPRAVPIVEAMAALVAVDHWIRDRGQNAPFGRCGRKA